MWSTWSCGRVVWARRHGRVWSTWSCGHVDMSTCGRHGYMGTSTWARMVDIIVWARRHGPPSRPRVSWASGVWGGGLPISQRLVSAYFASANTTHQAPCPASTAHKVVLHHRLPISLATHLAVSRPRILAFEKSVSTSPPTTPHTMPNHHHSPHAMPMGCPSCWAAHTVGPRISQCLVPAYCHLKKKG
jgi:hypothetical protein